MTVTEAKAELAEVIRSAEAGQRVIITRHGKPVAAVVEYDAIAQLKRIEAINYRELWPVKPATVPYRRSLPVRSQRDFPVIDAVRG